MTTLYLRLGGRASMSRLAKITYTHMSHDEILAEPLDRIDAETAIDRLTSLLVFSFGGSPYYEGQSLRSDFAYLLSDAFHYDRFAAHVEASLRIVGVSTARLREAMSVIELLRDFMLQRQVA